MAPRFLPTCPLKKSHSSGTQNWKVPSPRTHTFLCILNLADCASKMTTTLLSRPLRNSLPICCEIAKHSVPAELSARKDLPPVRTRERQSPDWRFQARHSGEWRPPAHRSWHPSATPRNMESLHRLRAVTVVCVSSKDVDCDRLLGGCTPSSLGGQIQNR